MRRDKRQTAWARELRRDQTDAERLLWLALRARHLDAKFRRQAPVGPYTVDFFCAGKRLIIEVDGGHHGDKEQAARDAVRSEWLTREGYTVVRLWNNDILENIEGVVHRLTEIVGQDSPSP